MLEAQHYFSFDKNNISHAALRHPFVTGVQWSCLLLLWKYMYPISHTVVLMLCICSYLSGKNTPEWALSADLRLSCYANYKI